MFVHIMFYKKGETFLFVFGDNTCHYSPKIAAIVDFRYDFPIVDFRYKKSR